MDIVPVTVVTDSICSPPAGKVKKLDIKLVPINIHIGGRSYKDLVDLKPDHFYRLLASARELPTTAAPQAERFKAVFSRILARGGEVFCLTVASALSNTYNAAAQACREFEEETEARVCLFDTEAAGAAASLMVVKAATMAGAGSSLQEIKTALNALVPEARFIGVIDTLDYIQKSGRVSRLAALAGNLFQIKPIICLHRGKTEIMGRPRGKLQALDMIVEKFASDTENADLVFATVTHANAKAEGLALARDIEAVHPGLAVDIIPFSPAMGTHTGPGVVGIGYTFL